MTSQAAACKPRNGKQDQKRQRGQQSEVLRDTEEDRGTAAHCGPETGQDQKPFTTRHEPINKMPMVNMVVGQGATPNAGISGQT